MAMTPVIDETSRVHLRTLVLIRWVAIVGQMATLLVVHYGLGFNLPLIAASIADRSCNVKEVILFANIAPGGVVSP